MNLIPRSLLLSAILASSAVVRAQDHSPALDEMVRDFVAEKQFIGSVLVAQNGTVVLNKGYGAANLEWDIPNSPSTKFRLGSLTKQFTAASILLLEERGLLKTDDLVKKYVPDAPEAWDRITLFHLLTHTSGIHSFTSDPEYKKIQSLPTTAEKTMALFRDKPLEFVPGEKYTYSNSGYIVLGFILEKVTGQAYADFVRQNIFLPAGMKDSGYDSNSALIAHRAEGYMPGTAGFVNAKYIDMTLPFSAGALYSTTEDLLHWEQALFGGKVLKPESLQKMTTPFLKDYALGIGSKTADGRKYFGHGGAIDGFTSWMTYFPDDQLTVIVLSNLQGAPTDQLAKNLSAISHGEKPELLSAKKGIVLAHDVAAQYVGRYEIKPELVIEVSLEGDQLFAQPTGAPKLELLAKADSVFFFKVMPGDLRFERDEQGRVTHFILTQPNGKQVKGTRK